MAEYKLELKGNLQVLSQALRRLDNVQLSAPSRAPCMR